MRYATDATHAMFARVIVWASQQREFPTPKQVSAEFGCHASTAAKWLWLYADAIGVTPPWSRA